MINNDHNRIPDDDPDELWDDDLGITGVPDIHDKEVEDIRYAEEGEDEPVSDGSSEGNDFEISDVESEDDFYADKEDKEEEGTESVETSTIKKRKGFFKFHKDDEEDGNDYYDNETEPEPEPEPKPKTVKLDPEDPDYWIEDEPDYAHIIPKPRKAWKWWVAAIFVLLIAIVALWAWFFRPYVDNAVRYGYIKSMVREGTFVKTFEGVLIPYKEVGDTAQLQLQEVRFSVAGDSLAAHMKGMMLECVPVKLEYEIYHTPILWKGNENLIITKADTADETKILPPEFR